MADNYNTAWRALLGAIGAANGDANPSIDEVDSLTPDQRFKAAEIVALLSISQELSALRQAKDDDAD
jgi:hypothetical protein